MIRGKRNIMKLGVVITTSITMLFTIGCSPKNIEESSILLEDVKKDAENSNLKVVSKEEYKITDNRILDAIMYVTPGIGYLVNDGSVYVEFTETDDKLCKTTKEKLLLENGEARIDSKGSITKSSRNVDNSSEIYTDLDGYVIKEIINDNWYENKIIKTNKIIIYNKEEVINTKNNKETKSRLTEKKSIDMPKDINYFYTIGIINNKLLYASGDYAGQFANEIGKIDLITGEFEDTIKVDPYRQAVLIDENTVAFNTISSENADFNIFNLKNKSNHNIIKDKNIWYMGINKNKEKIHYIEENDETRTVYVTSVSGNNKGQRCKVYENKNNEFFTVDISADGKEVYVFSFGAEPKIIKYKLNG